jgi:hypothetical protein
VAAAVGCNARGDAEPRPEAGNDSGEDAIGVLTIEPSSIALDLIMGQPQSQPFVARLDGLDVSQRVRWSFDEPAMGSIDVSGSFTPSGRRGGVGTITAALDGQMVDASVTLDTTIIVNSAGLDDAQRAMFGNPAGGADPALRWLYPFDQTVLPLDVRSPELQWTGSDAGDLFRLTMRSKHISYVEYFAADPLAPHTLPQSQWEDIQFSGAGPKSDPLVVELQRANGKQSYQPVSLELRIAQDFLIGSVYYWQLPDMCGGPENGQIVRLGASAEQPETIYQNGQCWGCHTVSRDGAKMMASFDTGFPFPLQTFDLKSQPVGLGSIRESTGLRGTFSAFNGTGDRIVFSNNASANPSAPNSQLHIVDAESGKLVGLNVMGDGCGEPAWSPDGSKMAAICNLSGQGWTFDSLTGDLRVGEVTTEQTSVGNIKTVAPQGALPGRPAYPSFSPDSKLVAYGRPVDGGRSSGDGTLWLVPTAGGAPVELARAATDGTAFNPVFAPRSGGGYHWIAFVSRRDYGHQLVRTDRQQLWITAIDASAAPGTDPSSPPFYLRGQRLCGKSENAFYALDPCKADGESCDHGMECCSKGCIADAQDGGPRCQPLDPDACIATGSGPCSDDEDCCGFTDGATCQAGFCEGEPAK